MVASSSCPTREDVLNTPARVLRYNTEASPGFIRDDGASNHAYLRGVGPRAQS